MRKRTYILSAFLFAFAMLFAQQSKESTDAQKGKASYYSRKATGARTASGERLHNDSLVCAHRTHPFGTMLKVTNLKNHKNVIVRVIDRGPHIKGRIIDLSYAAARELGMLADGIGTVEVEVYEPRGIPFKAADYVLPEIDFSVISEKYFIDSQVKLVPQDEK